MTDVSTIAKQLGKRGGEATKANGTDYKALSQKAHAKRWEAKRKAEEAKKPKMVNGFKTCSHGVILSIGICKKGCRE